MALPQTPPQMLGLHGRTPLSAEEVQQMRASRNAQYALANQADAQRIVRAYYGSLANVPNGGLHGGHRQATSPLQSYSTYAPYYRPGAASLTPAALAAAQLAYSSGYAHASPPEPIEDAGIRPGEVRAYRCWLIEQGFLRSMAMSNMWAPGEPMAGKATEYVSGGVHAWKSMSKALTYAAPYAPYGGVSIIVGQVDLWGDIVEHEHGYRAEFASIVSLDGILGGDSHRGKLLEALRKRYGVGGDDVLDLVDMYDAPIHPSIDFGPVQVGPDYFKPRRVGLSWYEKMAAFTVGALGMGGIIIFFVMLLG